MKKSLLILAVAVISFTAFSCRETTEEREESIESFDDAGTPVEEDVQTDGM